MDCTFTVTLPRLHTLRLRLLLFTFALHVAVSRFTFTIFARLHVARLPTVTVTDSTCRTLVRYAYGYVYSCVAPDFAFLPVAVYATFVVAFGLRLRLRFTDSRLQFCPFTAPVPRSHTVLVPLGLRFTHGWLPAVTFILRIHRYVGWLHARLRLHCVCGCSYAVTAFVTQFAFAFPFATLVTRYAFPRLYVWLRLPHVTLRTFGYVHVVNVPSYAVRVWLRLLRCRRLRFTRFTVCLRTRALLRFADFAFYRLRLFCTFVVTRLFALRC